MTKPIIKSDEEWSWWDDNLGGIIFWLSLTIISIFGILPWVVGVNKILKWIF